MASLEKQPPCGKSSHADSYTIIIPSSFWKKILNVLLSLKFLALDLDLLATWEMGHLEHNGEIKSKILSNSLSSHNDNELNKKENLRKKCELRFKKIRGGKRYFFFKSFSLSTNCEKSYSLTIANFMYTSALQK